MRDQFSGIEKWNADSLERYVREYAEAADTKLGMIAQPLRAAMTGRSVSPGVFEVMEILGKDETLGRLDDAIANK